MKTSYGCYIDVFYDKRKNCSYLCEEEDKNCLFDREQDGEETYNTGSEQDQDVANSKCLASSLYYNKCTRLV